ncbi:hypothetical protein BGAL_0534g00040 [Botrytis galanthina]|uniref:Uncharacterized protein n=1 Tax=Botrytis galanthina TaxID=278940 RepID=A0A4S8QU98_9HELO|nr:hypothetical protein BGAL_0534g00040 [Botrytis galanthina]
MSSNSNNTQRPLTDLEASVLDRVDAHLRLLSLEPLQRHSWDPANPRPRVAPRSRAAQQSRAAQRPVNSDLETSLPGSRLVVIDEPTFEALYQRTAMGIYTAEDEYIWQQIQEYADSIYGPEIDPPDIDTPEIDTPEVEYRPQDEWLFQQLTEYSRIRHASEIDTSSNGSEIDTTYDGSDINTSWNGAEIDTSYNGPDHEYLNQRYAGHLLNDPEAYREFQESWNARYPLVDEEEDQDEYAFEYGYHSE